MIELLNYIERAVRNIVNGKNAKGYVIGAIQARIVKTLMEEGVEPTALAQKGLVRPVILEEKKDNPLESILER